MTSNRSDENELADRLWEVERVVGEIEATIHAFADEIRTRQIVVVDDKDHPRIVGEVFGDVAELRLELPNAGGEPGPELLLFAVAFSHAGPIELGPAVGMQLRAQGRTVFELDAWPDLDGIWRPHLHMSGA